MDWNSRFTLISSQVFGVDLMLILGVVLVLMVWTGLRMWRFHLERRHGERELRSRRMDETGRPLPPRGTGICERCTSVCDAVFFLPDGRRLCETCYDADADRADSIGSIECRQREPAGKTGGSGVS